MGSHQREPKRDQVDHSCPRNPVTAPAIDDPRKELLLDVMPGCQEGFFITKLRNSCTMINHIQPLVGLLIDDLRCIIKLIATNIVIIEVVS